MSVEHQKHIRKFFSQRSIAYQPELAIVLGSPNAAIVLCQLLYWHTKGKRPDGWIFKTQEEMQKETGLTRTQQDHAIKLLMELKIIEKKLAQIPAKRHFRVDFVMLQKLLPSLKEKHKLNYLNPPICLDDNLQPITKITQKTTTNTTSENTIVNKRNFPQLRRDLISGKSILTGQKIRY